MVVAVSGATRLETWQNKPLLYLIKQPMWGESSLPTSFKMNLKSKNYSLTMKQYESVTKDHVTTVQKKTEPTQAEAQYTSPINKRAGWTLGKRVCPLLCGPQIFCLITSSWISSRTLLLLLESLNSQKRMKCKGDLKKSYGASCIFLIGNLNQT